MSPRVDPSRICLVAALVAMLLVAVPRLHAEWYASNAIGMAVSRIAASERSSHDYVLEVSLAQGVETRRLFHDGTETEVTTIERDGTGATETIVREGEISEVRRFGSEELLRWEERYRDGSLAERREYTYEEGRLATREAFGPSGVELYREQLSYWRDGGLRQVTRREGSGTIEFRYRDGRLVEEWATQPGLSERFVFDAAGRLLSRDLFVDSELSEHEERSYQSEEASAALREVVVEAGKRLERRRYDTQGRLVSERVETDGTLTLQRERVFAGGQLAEETELREGVRRRSEYRYEGEALVETRTYEAGALAKITYHRGEPPITSIDEIYRNGEVVLRVYSAGQNRVREEVVRGGEVIRVREIEPEPAE